MESPISQWIKATFSISDQLLHYAAHNLMNFAPPSLPPRDGAMKPTATMAMAMMVEGLCCQDWEGKESPWHASALDSLRYVANLHHDLQT